MILDSLSLIIESLGQREIHISVGSHFKGSNTMCIPSCTFLFIQFAVSAIYYHNYVKTEMLATFVFKKRFTGLSISVIVSVKV